MTPNGNGELRIKSGAEMRRERAEGVIIPLTDCNIRVRPIVMDDLLRNGQIPNELRAIALQQIFARTSEDELAHNEEAAERYWALVHYIVKLVAIEPRVVDKNPADNEIAIGDLERWDRQDIYFWAQQGVAGLKTFRDRQARNVPALPQQPGDELPAQQPIAGALAEEPRRALPV